MVRELDHNNNNKKKHYKNANKGNKQNTKKIQKFQPKRTTLVQNFPPRPFVDKTRLAKNLKIYQFFDILKQYVKPSTSIDFK